MSFEIWLSLILVFAAGGLTPGPAVMLVLASSLRYGFWLALAAALGVCAANVLWITLAATGVGALAEQFPQAFTVLKFAGLAFIVWLAWSTATQKIDTKLEEEVSNVFGTSAKKPPRYGRITALFFRGVGLQLANPNALVFFGGILPAFFNPDLAVFGQATIMVATVTATELTGLTIYALGARALAHQFSNPRFARVFYVCAGLVMAGSAFWALLSQT